MALRISKAQIVSMPKEFQDLLRAKPKAKRGGPSKAEKRYADLLEARRVSGQIKAWKAQPCGLRLAAKTFYHPDFLVVLNDGRCEFHEVKGWMRDDANVKLKVAAEMFPFWVFRLVDSATLEQRKAWNEPVRQAGGG